MTLLEKIKKLKWFDSISKLRDILEELYNSSSGGSGGNQDLQSVLDNGKFASFEDGSFVSIGNGSNLDRSTFFYIKSNDKGGSLGANIGGSFMSARDFNFNRSSYINVLNEDAGLGYINFNTSISNASINVIIPSPQSSFENYHFPSGKPSGTYTLATLDDILKINLDSRVYANNAAAITGGLTTKDLYRTSTGELRIVV